MEVVKQRTAQRPSWGQQDSPHLIWIWGAKGSLSPGFFNLLMFIFLYLSFLKNCNINKVIVFTFLSRGGMSQQDTERTTLTCQDVR